jgi:transcriptional regulator with XRE-family HTH domain
MNNKDARADGYLRDARVTLGLTLAQVAAAMGCSGPAICQLEQRPFDRVRPATVQRYQSALATADRRRAEARRQAGQALIDMGTAMVIDAVGVAPG